MRLDEQPQMAANDTSPLVLVVDDEVLIRLIAADILEGAGYRVIEACDADEARAILEADVGCDVIFTDVNMPGLMDGIELTRFVQRFYPEVPVVLTSGGVPLHVLSQADPAAVVMKPYTEANLTLAIRKALDQRSY